MPTDSITKFVDHVNRQELVRKLREKARLTKIGQKQATECVNCIVDEIKKAALQGRRVEIRGFGSFNLTHWNKRYARNPVTGESWWSNAQYVVRFKAGKEMTKCADQSRINEERVK